MNPGYLAHLNHEIEGLKEAGLYKIERVITSPQQPQMRANGRDVVCLCANNYLGLANHPEVIAAAKAVMDDHGFGMASVRFICGTQDIHRELEQKLAAFLGFEDTQLYSSCFDANGAIFEGLLGEEDATISDALNHASIIDGIRLCKAKRFRYANSDMADLEAQLKAADAEGARFKLVVTDGVFSMDGYIAKLGEICDLAEKHGAMVMVDDSHAVGFMGAHGRGTQEHCGVMGRVDFMTGTFGKALGVPPAATSRASGRPSNGCGRRPVPTYSRTPWPPASWPPPSRCWTCSRTAGISSSASTRMPGTSEQAWRRPDSSCCRVSIPSCRSCYTKPPWPRSSPSACWMRASTSLASSSPWCPRAWRASAPR